MRDFLGPMILGLEGYPFGEMTSRFYYRSEVKANWKLYMDAFQEFYHAPVLHANQSPAKYSKAAAEAGFEAPHYRIDGPHRLVSTSGIRAWEMDSEMRKPMEDICQSGLFGPWDKPDLGEMPAGLNPAKCDPWGLDSFQLFPNFVILIWGQGWYLTYHYWPTSYNSHIFEGTLYFPQPRTPRERIAQELAAVSFKEYGLQDANTLEATQTMVESQVVDRFLLCDQEVLIRHLHQETAAWVDDYQRKTAGGVERDDRHAADRIRGFGTVFGLVPRRASRSASRNGWPVRWPRCRPSMTPSRRGRRRRSPIATSFRSTTCRRTSST